MKKILFLTAIMALFFALSSHVYAAPAAAGKNDNSKWNKVVVFETTQGTIEFQLMANVAPKTCENFVSLVRKGYYNGIIFHRVIKGFMIQGGDPTGTGRGGESIWGKPFGDEVNSKVNFTEKGLLAMANAGPGTNGSQFFITTSTPTYLHMKHTIFGKVIKGMDVVTKIENVQTGQMDKPVQTQKIIKAYVKGEQAKAPAKGTK